MKKTSKRAIVISILSFLVFLIIGGLITFIEFGDEGKISYIDFKQKDYYNFQTIGKYIFDEMDNSQYKVGCEYFIESHVSNREAFYLDDNNINNILQKYDVVSVNIIDKDSIMFNCGAYFQQTGGVIITRNSVEPTTNYKNRGFDGDKIYLNKINKGIYSYTAGL
jgi:hypothetical protein